MDRLQIAGHRLVENLIHIDPRASSPAPKRTPPLGSSASATKTVRSTLMAFASLIPNPEMDSQILLMRLTRFPRLEEW